MRSYLPPDIADTIELPNAKTVKKQVRYFFFCPTNDGTNFEFASLTYPQVGKAADRWQDGSMHAFKMTIPAHTQGKSATEVDFCVSFFVFSTYTPPPLLICTRSL
jgi:hypothetical protein